MFTRVDRLRRSRARSFLRDRTGMVTADHVLSLYLAIWAVELCLTFCTLEYHSANHKFMIKILFHVSLLRIR